MFEDNQIKNNNKQNDVLDDLFQILQETYPIFDSSLVRKNAFYYEMKLNSITKENILDEMAAKMFNYDQSENKKPPLNSLLINDWLNQSLKQQITKSIIEKNQIKGKEQRNQPTKKDIKRSIIISSTSNINVKQTLSYPENDIYHQIPSNFNSNPAIVQFYPNYDIQEYSLVPKDECESEELYIKYFEKMRSFLLKNIDIKEDDPLINISKFVFVIHFETTDSKPILKDIRLMDPLNGFRKYKVKYEKEFPLKNYLVSGQIIYVEGDFINDEIVIKQYSQGFSIETYTINDAGLKPYFIESSPYLFFSVNGPFYSNDDIDLSIYTQTFIKIGESNPHFVLINGPFINFDHENIKIGDIEMSYFSLFESMIEIINKIFKDKRTIILISPSLGDVLNYYPLPQPPFNLAEMPAITKLDIYKKMKFISNPYIFQLNEMIIGLANFDFVKDISSNCIRIHNKAPIDIGLETVLEQKSFYPILQNNYNITTNETKIEKMTPIDIGQYEKLVFEASPDLIITSSSMNPFAKKIHSTLFINSGGLYKGKTIGSYARIISYPPNVSYNTVNALI